MDFAYNNRSNNRLEQETYWKQYGWMSRLGLNNAKAIVFALIFERDCTDDPARERITSKYIAQALDEGCPAPARGRRRPSTASRESSRRSTSLLPRDSSAPSWTRTACR